MVRTRGLIPEPTILLTVLLTAVSPAAAGPRAVEARRAAWTPRIDGEIEPAWAFADSASGFSQVEPDCGEPATEHTVAYVLYDDANLYVAFRCFGADVRAKLAGSNDYVRLYLDTFDDGQSCYHFEVSASGREDDWRVTDDGQWWEEWQGVWRSAARTFPGGYAVEMAVPFKTLRFRPGEQEWGIEFERYALGRNETSSWAGQDETGFKVSRIGRLRGIEPGAAGLHLEVYPVGLVRAEQDREADFGMDPVARVRPAAGLDLSWHPAPAANLQLTAFPDYAQIEADPYQVNLTRYELTLEEQRPFFVEAAETFGTGYNPLRLFYSRRIGKPLTGTSVVPVVAGAKFTGRFGRTSVGGLGAVTGETDYAWGDTTLTEPASWFSAVSLRRHVLANSEVGLLYAGKDNSGYRNHAVGTDGIFRRGDVTGKVFLAGTERDGRYGWGASANGRYRGSGWRADLNAKQICPRFDANGLGYTGWRGQNLNFTAGPEVRGLGPVQYGSLVVSGEAERAWDDGGLTYGGGPNLHVTFRNRASFGAWGWLERSWEGERVFWTSDVGAFVQTDYARPLRFYGYYNHTSLEYNYRRAELAPNGYALAQLTWTVFDRLRLVLDAEAFLEFGPAYEFEPDRDATFILSPTVSARFTPRMNLDLRGEVVRGYDPARGRGYRSYYASLLYAWAFLPRSTFHVSCSQALDNGTGELGLLGRVAVIKVRYLFVL